jgi:mercuric ion transport protein
MPYQHKPATGQSGESFTVGHPSVGEAFSTYLSLFASLATLFCCALPALLVLLGLSLTGVLAFFTAIPGWQHFGKYDVWLFPLCAVLLALGFYFAYFRRGVAAAEACESPEGGQETVCSIATHWNRRILWLSLSLYTLALVMNFWGIGWMRTHGYFNH